MQRERDRSRRTQWLLLSIALVAAALAAAACRWSAPNLPNSACGVPTATPSAQSPLLAERALSRAMPGWQALGCPTTQALTEAPASGSGGTPACPDVDVDGSPPSTWVGSLIEVGSGAGGRFCRYQLMESGGHRLVDARAFSALRERVGLDSKFRVELACPIVVPLQDSGSDAEAREAAEYYEKRSAQIDRYFAEFKRPQLKVGTRRGLQLLPPPKANVVVAVVDTAVVPYDQKELDRSQHGRAVGRMIARLACENPDTCALVRNYLGLPVFGNGREDRDPDKGGNRGTQPDLADAIRATLNEWERQPVAARPRLIINLSVGWHAVHERLDPSELRTLPVGKPLAYVSRPERSSLGSDYVRAVLERARCAGALIVAAAGNAIGDDRVLPVYPGGWETEPALSAEQCKRRGFLIPEDDTGPLVYAASAVDEYGAPLANTREAPSTKLPGGLATRAALGQAIVSHDPRSPDGFTPLLSGTSMAAAVISGVAARKWREKPYLRAAQLMRALPTSSCGVDDHKKPNLCLKGADGAECLPRYEIVGANAAVCPPLPHRENPPSGERQPPCETPTSSGTCPPSNATHRPLFEPWTWPQPGVPECVRCQLNWTAVGQGHVNVADVRTATALLRRLQVYTRNSPLDEGTSYAFPLDARRATLDIQLPERTPVQAFVTIEVPAEGDGTIEVEEAVPVLMP
jgi:hypothetical protein